MDATEGRGRPSLSGVGTSPQLRIRVPEDLHRRAEAEAVRCGTTVSAITRSAIEDRLRTDRREVRVQIELHREVLAAMLLDFEGVRRRARANLNRNRTTVRGPRARAWLDEWSSLLDRGPSVELVEVLTSDDEHGIDMRQVSPFAGTVSEPARRAAIARARDA